MRLQQLNEKQGDDLYIRKQAAHSGDVYLSQLFWACIVINLIFQVESNMTWHAGEKDDTEPLDVANYM